MKDPLAVPLEGYTQWASDAVELVFKNKDTCNMSQIYDDFRQWCMEDEMRCFFSNGIEDRMINNAVGIVSTVFEIGKLMVNDDSCYTDAEFADELGTFLEDFGKMSSYTTGFNHPWGAIGAAEHLSPEEFDSAAEQFFTENRMSPQAIMEMNWPKTLELFETAKADFDAINDWLIQPVVDRVESILLITLWYAYWYIYDFAWMVEIAAYYVESFVGSVILTAFYAVDTIWYTILGIDDMLYDGLMSAFFAVGEIAEYALWIVVDLAYFAFYLVTDVAEYAVYGVYSGVAWFGDYSMDMLWETVYTVEDLFYGSYYSIVDTIWYGYYEIDWYVRESLSMLFGCETWEAYEIGFDIAGMHVPYWMVIVGFFVLW